MPFRLVGLVLFLVVALVNYTGLCLALFLTGISQSELASRKSYHGVQSGVHRAGWALGSGLGTCVGLFVSLGSADCYCMARIDERFSGKTLFVM